MEGEYRGFSTSKGAGVHRGKDLAELPGSRIIQAVYSPELNPAEGIFEEVRRAIEGLVYPTLADKPHAADDFLTKLAARPDAIKQLCYWDWIRDNLYGIA